MKIGQKNLKKKQISVEITTLDDLWVLSKVIEVDDILIGSTQRKLKIGDSATDRNVKVVKKWMVLPILAEKVEYEPQLKVLRVTGPIQEGNDDVAKGEYHSFTLEVGGKITIQKPIWFSYHIKRLEAAEKEVQSQVMISICDREQALFGWLNAQGFNHIATLKGDVAKKYEGANANENFFLTLLKQLAQYKPRVVVMGCSHFWRKDLDKAFEDIGKPFKLSYVEADDVSFAGVTQILGSPDFNNILQDNVYAKQTQLFTEILGELGEKGSYGVEHLTRASASGAVADLLITNKLIAKSKEKETYAQIETILSLTESSKGVIHLIDEESPVCSQIDGLGGIVGLLRFKVE